MTREEKILQLMSDLDDNAKLRELLRFVVKSAITSIDDTRLDQLYLLLHPEPPPEEGT